MPSFILGFKDYAATHPEVGQPLCSEFTERGYFIGDAEYVVRRQDCTGGILRWYQESNLLLFVRWGTDSQGSRGTAALCETPHTGEGLP